MIVIVIFWPQSYCPNMLEGLRSHYIAVKTRFRHASVTTLEQSMQLPRLMTM